MFLRGIALLRKQVAKNIMLPDLSKMENVEMYFFFSLGVRILFELATPYIMLN